MFILFVIVAADTAAATTIPFATLIPAVISPSVIVFANSTLDFNVQAGIIAGGFCTSLVLITLFALFVFNMCALSCCANVACNNVGGCGDCSCRESCLGIFCTWLIYKYCACCCKDYRRKLAKQVEKLKQQHEMEIQEEERQEKELMLFGQKEAK
jgi:hypothetical protein